MFLFADEQVPNSYSAEQIADFQAGLAISGVKEYILIKEADAIAVEYGYERNLNNEFENPVTVLFVGVGFASSQAFVVQYTKVNFVMHYNS